MNISLGSCDSGRVKSPLKSFGEVGFGVVMVGLEVVGLGDGLGVALEVLLGVGRLVVSSDESCFELPSSLGKEDGGEVSSAVGAEGFNDGCDVGGDVLAIRGSEHLPHSTHTSWA